jgi:serine/threonine protein kinase
MMSAAYGFAADDEIEDQPRVLKFLYINNGLRKEMQFRTHFGNYRLDLPPGPSHSFVDDADIIALCRGGVVIKGHDTLTLEEVAVKIINWDIVRADDLNRHGPNNPRLEREIANECRVNKRLNDCLAPGHPLANHPGRAHVARSLKILQDNDLHNIVLVQELCAGGDLFGYAADRAEAGERFSGAELDGMRLQMVQGLAFLHEAGVAHLDLSVENVMLLSAPAQEPRGWGRGGGGGGGGEGGAAEEGLLLHHEQESPQTGVSAGRESGSPLPQTDQTTPTPVYYDCAAASAGAPPYGAGHSASGLGAVTAGEGGGGGGGREGGLNSEQQQRPAPFSLKIIDFGQSRLCQPPGSQVRLCVGTWNCGKPSYLAPEIQALQPPVCDVQAGEAAIFPFPADVWSLGCCLWVVAFFSHPYNLAAVRCEDFRNVVQGQLPEAAANYPEALSVLLRDIFAHADNPELRPTVMQLLQRAIHA